MRLAFWRKKEKDPKKKKKSAIREWVDAAIFALVAATIIRTFFFEAYTIPTPSMEGTLLVNDYMFVSKMAYGARMPMTPLALPLVHNEMPLFGGKSYTDAVQWKYRRLPGFREIKRYDIVVFNFPNNDTTIDDPRLRAFDYYGQIREMGRAPIYNNYKIITHPVDKRENYIKRCVGIPGDIIEIKDGILFVNNEKATIFPHQRSMFLLKSDNPINMTTDFLNKNNEIQIRGRVDSGMVVDMEYSVVDVVKKAFPQIIEIKEFQPNPKGIVVPGEGMAFPHNPSQFPWNNDNFGPITIPKKGVTIDLTPENYALYDKIIRTHEKNNVQYQNGQFVINGTPSNQYTFQMDYYWMMGDNRHQSLDSRNWGFVPEDHVVGTPSFVWLSYNKGGLFSGIRWSRLFRSPSTLQE